MTHKQLLKRWLHNMMFTTPVMRIIAEQRRMNSRRPVNPRTHVGTVRIGRNDPCYCQMGRHTGVKFKDCCYREQIQMLVDKQGVTPEYAEYLKKETAYFNKHRRLPCTR